nr:transposase [Pseudorhodobacter turbinis]
MATPHTIASLKRGRLPNDGLTSVRCLAHARRKFFETSLATGSPLAHRAVQMFRKMYAVEKAAHGLPPADREALRQKYSLPILDQLHSELLENRDEAHGGLRTAINYTLKAFDSLRHFIFDGKLEIDNNPVERCIRGIALTKKNSLFAGTHEAADVWAIYYSLIESARLNKINARSYVNWVVGEIERTRGEIDYSLLMPWHCPNGHIEN